MLIEMIDMDSKEILSYMSVMIVQIVCRKINVRNFIRK